MPGNSARSPGDAQHLGGAAPLQHAGYDAPPPGIVVEQVLPSSLQSATSGKPRRVGGAEGGQVAVSPI